MASIGEIWADPLGDFYVVIGETEDSILIGGQWLPKDLELLGWKLK